MKEGAGDAVRALERIRVHEEGPASFNAFLSIARETDIEGATSRGMLSGGAVAVKDNLVTEGLPTTCASKLLEGFVSPYSAAVVESVIVGARPRGKSPERFMQKMNRKRQPR